MKAAKRITPVWAVIGGGGTGGHIVPAIAIGQALVARGHPADAIRFVGSSRGMEQRMVPAAGFPVELLPGRGISRSLTVSNFGAVAGLLAAVGRAIVLLRRYRPAVVIVVGGYASVACSVAAAIWRVPLIVAEQNAVPGLANRLAGRFAAACAISFPGTPLPRAVLTGNPVRPEILAIDTTVAGKAAARAELGLPDGRLVIAVVGGSLGARKINQAVAALAIRWRDRSDLVIRHVVGRRDFDEGSTPGSSPDSQLLPGGLIYERVAFEDRMHLLLAASDVTVQRSGASSVSEIAAAGLPAVLVPLPGAPGDHQTLNALRLAGSGGAVVVSDEDCTAERLADELEGILSDPARRAAMAAAVRTMAYPNAAFDVAALAEKYARG